MRGTSQLKYTGLSGLISPRQLAAISYTQIAVALDLLPVLEDPGLVHAMLAEVCLGGLVERDELRVAHPLGLEGIDLGAAGARHLQGVDPLGQGLDLGVCDPEDELVVTRVHGRVDQPPALAVRPGDDEVLGARGRPTGGAPPSAC